MDVPQSVTLTVWEPSEREALKIRALARTVNSNKSRGESRATLIEVPRSVPAQPTGDRPD